MQVEIGFWGSKNRMANSPYVESERQKKFQLCLAGVIKLPYDMLSFLSFPALSKNVFLFFFPFHHPGCRVHQSKYQHTELYSAFIIRILLVYY